MNKCKSIINIHNINSILISGGVSSNKELRLEFANFASSVDLNIYFSPINLCMDNGSMIAFLGFIKFLESNIDFDLSINVNTRMKI